MRSLARARMALSGDLTLGTFFDSTASARGDARFVTEQGGLELTHAEAADRVDRLAGVIHRRIEVGGRVVVATPNRIDQLLVCLAACRAGGVAVPVNPQMRPEEVRHVVEDARPDLVVEDLDQILGGDRLSTLHHSEPGDLAALFYTSGTTGKPKGVRLTHRALVGQVAAGALWPSWPRRDEAVVSLPIAHIMGTVTLLGLAAAGIPVYFIPHFRPDEVLDAIETRRSSIFIGVPAMYRLLMEAGAPDRDLSSVRVWASGADAMPTELAKAFKKMGASATLPMVGPVGEAMFAEGYGMVEVGGGVATKISPPLTNFGLGNSLGVPLPGYSFKVVDDDGDEVRAGGEGELLVRGPGVLDGYWDAPEASADVLTDDGWLRTGDLARRGPLGTALFAGRKKDVIMNGGYSVYALEVERALEEHPAVAEAAVVARPDDTTGEVPVAAVRLTADADVTAEDLLTWSSERMADYKAPREIVVVDELPRTGTRKLQKQELLEHFT